jgi:hypothetical protein
VFIGRQPVAQRGVERAVTRHAADRARAHPRCCVAPRSCRRRS